MSMLKEVTGTWEVALASGKSRLWAVSLFSHNLNPPRHIPEAIMRPESICLDELCHVTLAFNLGVEYSEAGFLAMGGESFDGAEEAF
jgi:hypothetical protein